MTKRKFNKLTPADPVKRHAYYHRALGICPGSWRMINLDNFCRVALVGQTYMPGSYRSITWNGRRAVWMTNEECEAMLKRRRARQRRLRAAAKGSPQR